MGYDMRLFSIDECERIIPAGEGNRELFLECTRSVARTGSYLYEPSLWTKFTSDPILVLAGLAILTAILVYAWRTRQF